MLASKQHKSFHDNLGFMKGSDSGPIFGICLIETFTNCIANLELMNFSNDFCDSLFLVLVFVVVKKSLSHHAAECNK